MRFFSKIFTKLSVKSFQSSCIRIDDNTLANDNLKNYNNYVKSTYASYGILYCLNKYKIPSGTMCNQENNARVWKIIEEYINEMLQQIKQDILKYSFIQNYKD